MTQPDELEFDAPEADVAEQAIDAGPTDEDDFTPTASLEAPEWDALEQARAVPSPDEDDYR